MSDSVDADLIFVNALLWSPGFEKPRPGAVAIGGERIVRVGSDARCEADAANNARVINVHGHLILPGFVDAHAHLLHTGPRMEWVQLQGISSLAGVQAVVARKARETKGRVWILGRGWDESIWPERRYPTRHDLDEVAGDKPILLRRVDGHMSVVNTAALTILRIPKSTPGLEVDATGQPTGILKEAAAELAGERTTPTTAQLVKSFPRMLHLAHSLGIASIHDIVNERGLQAYERLARRGVLSLRVSVMPEVNLLSLMKKRKGKSGFEGGWLRLGALKAYSDGSLGARTAALHEPYADAPNERGQLMYGGGKLEKVVGKVVRSGFQLAIHAIGDRAIDAALDAYETASGREFDDNHRHRIEHFELPSGEALDRCRELGIIPVMEPNFVVNWSQLGGLYDARLGQERARRNNPHRLILKKGLRLAFGSDGMPYGPLLGLHGAVTPPHPDQRISLQEALEAYTLGGAFTSFEENEKGRLAEGMLADLAVVDGTWDGGGRSLSHWTIAATVVGGKIVYKRPAIAHD
jgi:predicted amidohydrolase YtcJ